MPTGACGINCDVCRLHIDGVCSSCGPGNSKQGKDKLAAQKRLLGSPCPVLACACFKQITFCMRDCDLFGCENFSTGPYPFSQSFIDMQKRRREEENRTYAADGSHLTVAPHYWQGAAERSPVDICNFTFFQEVGAGRWQFDFLNETVQVDLTEQCLLRLDNGHWHKSEDPLLTLVTVIYLYHIDGVYPLGKDRVGIQDLKERHFFTGPHELRTQPLLARFGDDPDGFRRTGEALKGRSMDLADVSFELRPFPRVPVYFLFWYGDAEFKPRLQVLLDRPTEKFLAADAIWALINRVIAAFTRPQP